MKLSFEQIQSAIRGVAFIKQDGGKVSIHRFTEAQEEMYRARSSSSYLKAFATAGVILEFDTDSKKLGISVEVSPASSREFFVHSIFANGRRIGELSGKIQSDQKNLPCEGIFALGGGMKRIKVLFPWTVASQICSIDLDDGAQFSPVIKKKKILIYGDSITQGYDAMRPENSYAACMAAALNVDGICKAIGGEMFCPALADLPDDVKPDLITVAYGTNDWSHSPKEMFLEDSREFFVNLRRNYPDTPIIALAPIWRADMCRETLVGDFRSIVPHYCDIAGKVCNMTVMDCFDFVPHSPDYFSDLRLHPNDEGFRHYADSLIKELKKYVDFGSEANE